MVKRIVTALIIVVLLLTIYWAYGRYTGNARLRDGEVSVSDSRDGDEQAARSSSPTRSEASSNANTQSASLAQLQTAVATPASSTTAAPATDSQAPNAPNGMAIAGTGHFQVYRQGNLTWRINTDDGSTCILFATNEEWRKPLVFNHGCPNG